MTAARRHVCIVTSECIGPSRGGGIGTAMTGLSQVLAEAEFAVTILFTGHDNLSATDRAALANGYAAEGILLQWLDRGGTTYAGPEAAHGFATPWLVWDAIQSIRPDIVQFNDCMGEGVVALAMQRLGLGLSGVPTLVALHSPTEWIWAVNRNLPTNLLHVAFTEAERAMLPLADRLWGPSRYLIDWARGHGMALPDVAEVRPYALPRLPVGGGEWPDGEAGVERNGKPVRTIAFFGRVEERKGICLFCDAIDRLGPRLAAGGITVALLGKEGTVDDDLAGAFVERRAKAWPVPYVWHRDFDQATAQAWLRDNGALAVVASPADNSPCTVYEALTLGLPMIAADTGGIGEIVHPDGRASHLFAYDSAALEAAIARHLDRPLPPARLAVPQAEARRRWVELFNTVTAVPADIRAPLPLAGVLIDAAPGRNLDATLDSLALAAPGVAVAVTDRHGLVADDDPRGLHTAAALSAWLGGCGDGVVLVLRAGLAVDAAGLARCLTAAPVADSLWSVVVDGAGRHHVALGSPVIAEQAGALPTGCMLVTADAARLALADTPLNPAMEFFGLPDALVSAPGHAALPVAVTVATCDGDIPREQGQRLTRERVAAYARLSGYRRFYQAALATAVHNPVPRFGDGHRRVASRLERMRLGRLVAFLRRPRPRRLLLRLFGRSG